MILDSKELEKWEKTAQSERPSDQHFPVKIDRDKLLGLIQAIKVLSEGLEIVGGKQQIYAKETLEKVWGK